MHELFTILKDIGEYTLNIKKYWLAPLLFVILLMGLLFLGSTETGIAPFIYTLF
jgi:hypothetical protein